MAVDIRERLLAMMAVEKRLITEKQLTECLNIHEFFDQRPLAEILLDKGYLTQARLDKLRRVMDQGVSGDVEEPSIDARTKFGVLALRMRFVLPDQLSAALEEQKQLRDLGVKIPLGQILMSLGAITPEQVARILRVQGKNYLRCEACAVGFTVVGYKWDEFYRCKKCDGDLDEASPPAIPRAAIESRLHPADEDDDAWFVDDVGVEVVEDDDSDDDDEDDDDDDPLMLKEIEF